jgi:hypothetical protein
VSEQPVWARPLFRGREVVLSAVLDLEPLLLAGGHHVQAGPPGNALLEVLTTITRPREHLAPTASESCDAARAARWAGRPAAKGGRVPKATRRAR